MIEFMVLGLPRSGTTWAANWLTDVHTLCLHDPLFTYRPEQLDSIYVQGNRQLGVACTGLAKFHDWVNKHPAKKLIVHRDIGEINASLDALGLPQVGQVEQGELRAIRGRHVSWENLFDTSTAGHIYEELTGLPFDRERHKLLTLMNVQPNFAKLPVDGQVMRDLVARLGGRPCLG